MVAGKSCLKGKLIFIAGFTCTYNNGFAIHIEDMHIIKSSIRTNERNTFFNFSIKTYTYIFIFAFVWILERFCGSALRRKNKQHVIAIIRRRLVVEFGVAVFKLKRCFGNFFECFGTIPLCHKPKIIAKHLFTSG